MGAEKSSGPNDLHMSFYQKMWDVESRLTRCVFQSLMVKLGDFTAGVEYHHNGSNPEDKESCEDWRFQAD